MRCIPLLEDSDGLFMAGESLDQVWRDCYHLKGDRWMDTGTVLRGYGTACPAEGCHRCTNPDCFYADFIRHYWSHPRGD